MAREQLSRGRGRGTGRALSSSEVPGYLSNVKEHSMGRSLSVPYRGGDMLHHTQRVEEGVMPGVGNGRCLLIKTCHV